MPFCTIGARHFGSLSTWDEVDEISGSRYRLFHQVGRSRTLGKYHTTKCQELCLEEHCMQVWGAQSISVWQWTTIWQCTFQGLLWTLQNSKSLFLACPSPSKRSGRSCKPILVENHQDSAWGGKGSMARRATRCSMGIQNNGENPYRRNSFQVSLWKRNSHTCRSAHSQP